MFERGDVERAVDVQRRAYRLLLWMEEAFERGFITPDAAGQYASTDEATLAWLDRHYRNLPEDARPQRRDLPTFSRFFSTFLITSFDLEAEPGERLVSEDAHCFCPCCAWMVRQPHLRTKKVTAADRKRAHRLQGDLLHSIAAAHGPILTDAACDEILSDPSIREAVGLCTYAVDLQRRLKGVTHGAATLVLWRSFAWTAEGSPRKDFTLTADAILEAEEKVTARVRATTEA